MTKYGTPSNFFLLKIFYQNDSEWPKMDFKHNFWKCNILSASLIHFFTFILLGISSDSDFKPSCQNIHP